MPQTPRPVRRKDRQSSPEEALELLTRGEYGVLSTVGPDGTPYGVPVSYALCDAMGEKEIVFHSAIEGRKVEHLEAVPRASFCVVGETELLPEMFSTRYQSAIAEGPVRELQGEEKIAALTALTDKYSPQIPAKAAAYIANDQHRTRVFALRVISIAGKRRR